MDKIMKTLVFSCILFSIVAASSAQNCLTYSFPNNNIYSACTILPVQNSVLHWTYHQTNHTVNIAYRHGGVSTSQWVAWALNIDGRGMAGAQSLVAIRDSSGAIRAYTSPISSYTTQLAAAPLSFNVRNISAEFTTNGEIIIFATLELPSGRTNFNQVWQIGPLSGGTPSQHNTNTNSENTNSVGTVDFSSGQTSSGGGVGVLRRRRKNVHGVLNTVSWGILLPLGALTARYLKVFKSADPAWFYLHAVCQSSAYIVGVAGWGTGLKLGSDSEGIQFDKHRNIGITLFCLGTLQVFALLLRPKKDHKYRLYWNIYHHMIGYAVIILSIVNIFEGFDILDPAKKWKRAYIGVLIFLGAVAAILEAFTWFIVLKRKRNGSDKYPHAVNGPNGGSDKYPHAVNGANGANGYSGYRSQQAA